MALRRHSGSRLSSRYRDRRRTRRWIIPSICRSLTRPVTPSTTGLPYAEHFNFSIQRELSRNTVLTLAYVGTEGHRLISQYDANPGNAALCLQLITENATPTCGPGLEQQTFTLPNGSQVLGTRTALGPNFGYGNSYTANISNSNYNSLQDQRRAQGRRYHVPRGIYIREIDRQRLRVQ